MQKWVFIFLIGSIFGACGKLEAKKTSRSATTSSCTQKLNGKWEFGRAPFGCAMNPALAAAMANDYKTLVFDENKSADEEKKRFVREMHSFMTDYSLAYFKRREPTATAEETDNWRLLVLATAHQESYWTQYRFGQDSLFRFFRGDNGHGYGMMQIDDRWHKEFIKSQKVFDLEQHFIYALDMLYDARKSVLKSPCGSNTTGENLNRSIYSIYNGGPRSKCRWQSAGDKWSRNDKGFLEKYKSKAWEKDLQ